MDQISQGKLERIQAIDQFRGFVILLMVVFNYLSGIESVPDWLKHAPDIGMNIPDLGAPVFIFAIGLTYGLSYRRRVKQDGLPAARGHFLRRYLAFLGLGAIITAAQSALGIKVELLDWGVLQSIGVAGLLALAVIAVPPWGRLGIGLALLTLYQILLDRYWLDLVLNSQHGGLPGSISWAAVLILATVLGDVYQDRKQRKYFPWLALGLLLAGLLLAVFVPVSKNRLTASYDLITLGFSGLVFCIFYLGNFRLDYFSAWGRNPLLLYLLAFILSAIFVLPGISWWYHKAPWWMIGGQISFILAILSWLAIYWDKRGFNFSI